MKINEALTKAAEENSQGLAKETPLEATERSKTHIGTAKRLDAFEIVLRELDNYDEYMAALGIGLGWMRRNNPAKLKTSYRLWGGVFTTGTQDSEAAMSDIMKRFNTWWNYMTIRSMINKRQCAVGICAEGRTFQELGWTHNIHNMTAKSYAIQGIKQFEELFRKEKSETDKTYGFHRPDLLDQNRFLKIAKIVIFEENV